MADDKDPWLEEIKDSDVVDPLSATARSARNALMLSNLALFAVVQIGFEPTKVPVLGIEGTLEPAAIHLLAWVILVYFFLNFVLTIGAEFQAWDSRLDTLRERRSRRKKSELDARIAKIAADEAHPHSEGWEAQLIGSANLAMMLDWRRHRTFYWLRMTLEGPVTIFLTVINIVAAILREGGHHLWH